MISYFLFLNSPQMWEHTAISYEVVSDRKMGSRRVAHNIRIRDISRAETVFFT